MQLSRTLKRSFYSYSPLVGNKNDDPNSKVVETTDAQKFAEQMSINLFETSAKENINVEEVGQGSSGISSGKLNGWSCSWDMDLKARLLLLVEGKKTSSHPKNVS